MEKSLLQDRHSTLWNLHRGRMGMRIRQNFLLAHMVFYAVFQDPGHQLRLLEEAMESMCQLLFGTDLHGMWTLFPSIKEELI